MLPVIEIDCHYGYLESGGDEEENDDLSQHLATTLAILNTSSGVVKTAPVPTKEVNANSTNLPAKRR